MITSMTGFAAVTREEEKATVTVAIHALNHRHLDLQLRMPQSLGALEADIRSGLGDAAAPVESPVKVYEPATVALADPALAKDSGLLSGLRSLFRN